jgi:predicted ferric reductase
VILVFRSTNFSELSGSSLLYSFGRLSGLIGFLFLSILILSGETSRLFDKFFGMDKIIKFQRKFALITSFFVISHPVLFILSDSFFLKYLLPDFASIPMALGTFAFYIFIIVSISSVLYKRISYNVWQYIHIGTYFLFFFSFYHAIKIGPDVNNLFVKSLFYLLFFVMIVGIIYRTNYKLKQRKRKFVVKEIRWETKDTFTLVLKPHEKFKFMAGQFCFLRINKEKLHARHPFTISSSPSEKTLNFTIKMSGRFTKVASELKVGEEVVVEGPFGTFTFEDSEKDLVFIAGGVGVTPFMSMIKDNLNRKINNDMLLLYGVRTKNEIIFKKKLDSVKGLNKVYVLSREKGGKVFESGHVNKKMIQKYVKNIGNSLFYLCGPQVMMKSIKESLLNLGVREKDIKMESFFW